MFTGESWLESIIGTQPGYKFDSAFRLFGRFKWFIGWHCDCNTYQHTSRLRTAKETQVKTFNNALQVMVLVFCVASTLWVLNEVGQSREAVYAVVSR